MDELSSQEINNIPMSFNEVKSIIQSGDYLKLKEIIESGRIKDINMKEDRNKGISLLHLACFSGNIDMVRLIIESGFIISDRVLLTLFKCTDIIVNCDIVNVICEYIVDVNYEEHTYKSFLGYACMAGNVELTRLLLERGAIVDLSTLRAACMMELTEIVRLLLTCNETSHKLSKRSVSVPLKCSSRYGHLAIVRYLVEYGTDQQGLNGALYEAIDHDHRDVTEYLLDNGAIFSSQTNQTCNELIWACHRGASDVVDLLLARGTDPNTVDSRGESALHAALYCPVILNTFFEHGADPNVYLKDGSTVLLELTRYSNGSLTETLTILLQSGLVDVNLPHAHTGETALMIAALAQHIEYVKLLLHYGADVTQVNSDGKSVIDQLNGQEGKAEGYTEVIKLCTQYIKTNKPTTGPILK